MAKPKNKITIEELIDMVAGKSQKAESILLAIKNGSRWADEDFRAKFYGAPNHIQDLKKFWFPRHIQELVGKIEKVKAVEIQPRGSGRRRAVYQFLDNWMDDHDGEITKPVVDVYNIHCSCGASFLGREPEHQLFCEACKNTTYVVTNNQKDEMNKDQIPIMIEIIRARNITETLRHKVEIKLVNLLLANGLTEEEISSHFREAGYSDEAIGAFFGE